MKKMALFATFMLVVNAFAYPDPTRYGGMVGNNRYPSGTSEFQAPKFESETMYNTWMNCTKHGRVRPSKCKLCDRNGKAFIKTGCENCLRKAHDENVAFVKEKKAQEILKETKAQEINAKRDAQILRQAEIESYKFEKEFVDSITLTNGQIVAYSPELIQLLPDVELFKFHIVQRISYGRYLAKNVGLDGKLYLLESGNDSYVDDDEISEFGYVSKATYDYVTALGTKKGCGYL